MSISAISSSVIPSTAKPLQATGGNILLRIQDLVCRINHQLSRLSEETSQRSQTMKREYRVSSLNAANLLKRVGNVSLGTSIVGIALTGAVISGSHLYPQWKNTLEFLSSSTGDRLGVADRLVKGSSECYSSYLNSQQSKEGSIASLRQTEIGNEAQKSGEARDLQSELQQILGNLRELFKRASSS